jgi:hypothetical protein
MKKIYTVAGVMLFFFTANAQQPITPGPAATPATIFSEAKLKAVHGTQDRSTTWWLNYAFAQDSVFGGLAVLNANYLFPDSTVLGEFGTGTFDNVWIHSIAQTLDPTSFAFNYASGCTLTDADAYSVDSMGLVYAYERNIQNPAIVDTLLIKLTHNGTSANFLSSGFIGTTASNYGTDTVGFKIPKYDYVNNRAAGTTNTSVIKIPLTDADTAVTFYGYKSFGVGNFTVPAGRVVAVSISFVPGYSYNFGDTLETQLNSFFFASYEEQGTGTFPVYTDCNYQAANCDYNVSGIVRSAERYNVTGNSWNGNYIPTYAFTAPYSLENHLIDWQVSGPLVGVNEVSSNGITLQQNIPNPSNGSTMINYSIANSGNVMLEVYDVTGKLVESVDQGTQAAGQHSVNLNTSSYAPGVYFYTLNVDGVKVTRKMVISE